MDYPKDFYCDSCDNSHWERVLGRDNDEIVIPCSMCEYYMELCGICNHRIYDCHCKKYRLR